MTKMLELKTFGINKYVFIKQKNDLFRYRKNICKCLRKKTRKKKKSTKDYDEKLWKWEKRPFSENTDVQFTSQ